MASFKKYYLIRIILTTLFGAALGVAFFVARSFADEVFDVLLIAMGLMMAVINLPPMLYSLFHIRKKGEWISFVISLAAVAFGAVFTLVQRDGLLLALGVYAVLMPTVRVLLVNDRKKQIKRELPGMIFGLFMVFVSLTELEELVFTVCGSAVLGISVLYLLWGLVTMKFRFAAYDHCVKEQALVPVEESIPTQNEK